MLGLGSSLQIDLLGITVIKYGVFPTDFFWYLWLNSTGCRKGPQITNSLSKGATIMGNLSRYSTADLEGLMEKIAKNSIGVDSYFDNFFNLTTQQSYPPYNLIQINNVESRLEIALAGFKKNEVKVYTEHGKLFVKGSKEEKSEEVQYAHRGLANRSFERQWTITDDVEIKEVIFEDGLLTINLGKVVPEHHARHDWL